MDTNIDLHFKTNVQLKSIIGKDLINDDNIAILELVKNSFDADAKKVDITFVNLKNSDDNNLTNNNNFTDFTSRLIIKDDGVGMSLVDIKDKWLNIAYSEKKNNTRQHNRMMAGAKGVGRFSCDRLGEFLNLYTKQKNSENYIKIFIDWKAFEIENDKDKEIQSIAIKYDILNENELFEYKIAPFQQGVVLEVIKLRSKWVYPVKNETGTIIDWDTKKLIDLKRYLEKLINPNQAFEKSDFGIYLNVMGFEGENERKKNEEKFIGKVENSIFEKLDFKTTSIESNIIDGGKVIYTELKDKGQIIFWIKEKNEFYPEIKNVKIILYYLNPYTKAFFTKQTGVRPIDYGSIYVFLNGFRVPPYGEFGDDWLNLELRKGQGYARFLGQRELVGRIEILDSENDFKVISSREGIIKNESYKKLTEQKNGYFFKIFKRLEKYVVDGLAWDSIPEDDRDKISDIEKKIISGETNENDLVFREDDVTKRKRIYASIHSIISAKADTVIKIYINENLILDKINEEKKNSEREFEQLISDFENKKIDVDVLNRILQKKAEQNKDLEKQLADFSKYTTTEATAKAITELQYYKETIVRQTQIIEELKVKLEKEKEEKEEQKKIIQLLESQKEVAEQRVIEEKNRRFEAEKETNRLKEIEIPALKQELEQQISETLFSKADRGTEKDDLLSIQHHIYRHSAQHITAYIEQLVDSINKDSPKDELLKLASKISFENKKIITLSRFVTKAQFDTTVTKIHADLIKFVNEYVLNVYQEYSHFIMNNQNLRMTATTPQNIIFDCSFRPIELIIILDNILNNSLKANAKNVNISWESISTSEIILHILDDGKGIEDKYLQRIFDPRFTTTNGSGLGLYHTKEVIEKMGGEISVNNKLKQGVEFILKFKK